MCDFAYHQEALRKARILERKQHALAKTGGKPCEQETRQREFQYFENSGQDSRRSINVQQGTGYDSINLPPSASYVPQSVQSGIYKDLKKQQKTLRNHNLVMGPIDAFNEYFDPNNYKPSYQKY